MNIKNILIALFLSLISLTACTKKELTKEEIANLPFEEQKAYCSKKVVGKTTDQISTTYGTAFLNPGEYFTVEDHEYFLKEIQKIDTCYLFAMIIAHEKTGAYIGRNALVDSISSVSKRELNKIKGVVKKETNSARKSIRELQSQKSGDGSVVSK